MIIDVPLPEMWGRAASYCALVAYPGMEDGDRRKRWIGAALGATYKVQGKHVPARDLPIPKRERIEGIVREGANRILKRRIPAVYIATRLLLPLPLGGMRAEDAYRTLLDASDDLGFGDDVSNVRRLCWKESLPALSMAAPLRPLLQDKPLAQLFYDDTWVSDAIQLARLCVPAIAWAFRPPYLLAPQAPKSPASLPSNPAQIVTRLSE